MLTSVVLKLDCLAGLLQFLAMLLGVAPVYPELGAKSSSFLFALS